MRIAVAQTRPVKGDISANIDTHKRLIELAVSYKADAIFFPELSLTGYEPELASELSSDQDDEKLDCFQEISDRHNITIGLGLPTKVDPGTRISMIIFQPGTTRQTYSKQQLHADEFPFFVSGEKQIVLTVGDKKIAPAICYESLQPSHADDAVQLGADIYLASVAKSQNGMAKAMKHYPEVARRNSIPVLMANCVGFCDNFESVGQTAAWTKQGKLAGQLDEESEGVLIFDTDTEEAIKQAYVNRP